MDKNVIPVSLMDEECEICSCFNPLLERRTLLKAALGMVLGLPFIDPALAQPTSPTAAPPEEGDQFVFAFGDKKGEIITPKDLPLGGPQVMAYPMDPKTKVVKDGSRLNKIIIIHLDPIELSEETRAHSVEGIVAYSAICTHQGCDVTEWKSKEKVFLCPCHESEFDPKNEAQVVHGPASRRLAALPLKLVEGALVAAGGFIGSIGPRRSY
ncbi:MAG TPA: Rieske (2Fe-2S) protein [Candidatus Limnocylindrales bacterium]|nr:Rieske (2Fe-2S) protein [Candidatus Limnocylindrales bacterium]